MLNGFLLRRRHGPPPSLERIPQPLVDSSETGLRPASLRLNPICSSCSTGPPDPLPQSGGPGSDSLHLVRPRSLQQSEDSPHPTASSVAQPLPPSRLVNPVVPELPTSGVSLSVHSSSLS